MQIRLWLAGAAILGALMCWGCGGTTIYDIDGFWGLGDVQFYYGNSRTWVLYDAEIEVDTVEEVVYLSGYDSNDDLWAYSGGYTRNENRVTVEDMPEFQLGSRDVMDLRLQFGSRRVDGSATNWVYDESDHLTDVGSATLHGQKLTETAARDLDTAKNEARSPKTLR